MNSEIPDMHSQQTFLALQLSLIIAAISTAAIYVLDKFMFKHTDFRPLTEFQFYGVLFIVVLGLVMGLLFYREEKEDVVEESSEFRKKMHKKKLKKARKAKTRAR